MHHRCTPARQGGKDGISACRAFAGRKKKRKKRKHESRSIDVDVYLLTVAVLLLADVNKRPSLNPKIYTRLDRTSRDRLDWHHICTKRARPGGAVLSLFLMITVLRLSRFEWGLFFNLSFPHLLSQQGPTGYSEA